MTEIPCPLAVRRMVSFSEVVYEGTCTVDGVRAAKVDTPAEAEGLWQKRVIPVCVDPSNSAQTVFAT